MMQAAAPAFRQRILDRAIEVLLIVLCFTASVYGLVQLATETVLS